MHGVLDFLEDSPDMLPVEELLLLMAGITAKKIKDDYEADKQGKQRNRISKCAREYFIWKHGLAHVAELKRVQMAASLRYFANMEDGPIRKTRP